MTTFLMPFKMAKKYYFLYNYDLIKVILNNEILKLIA